MSDLKPGKKELVEEILRLKEQRQAVFLVHYYQKLEIHALADFLGDSLGLSQQAAQTDAPMIVFCGVHFMAETAAILSPDKTVLLPVKNAGCPMADMADIDDLLDLKAQHPDAAVVSYVNTTARIKAESDICCTSANAVDVVRSIPQKKIIFVPDKNLAHWVSRHVDKEIIPWEGFCPPHQSLTAQMIIEEKEKHPDAVVMCHPECLPEVLDLADEVASTSGMERYVKTLSPGSTVIVGTEKEMAAYFKQKHPTIDFIVPSDWLVCPNMKKNRLEDVLSALQNIQHVVKVEKDIADQARKALNRMLEITKK